MRLNRLNKTRTAFADKFEELKSYHAGSRNFEELFEELLKLSRNRSEEQQRHVRENMTEEELVIFDIPTRPAPELTAEERTEVNKVARELLNGLKQLLVLNWRQKSTARSQIKLAIEDVLDTLPAAYDRPLYAQKLLRPLRARSRERPRARYGRLCSGSLIGMGFGGAAAFRPATRATKGPVRSRTARPSPGQLLATPCLDSLPQFGKSCPKRFARSSPCRGPRQRLASGKFKGKWYRAIDGTAQPGGVIEGGKPQPLRSLWCGQDCVARFRRE